MELPQTTIRVISFNLTCRHNPGIDERLFQYRVLQVGGRDLKEHVNKLEQTHITIVK